MFKPLMLLPPLIFAALAALFYFGMYRDDPDALPSTFVGRAAPVIEARPLANLPTFDNAVLNQPGAKVVNFWASWCPPCRKEHPMLKELAEIVPVYGVNRDLTEAAALGFLDELGNPFAAIVFDDRNRQSIEWGVYGLPETFVIDAQGRVVLRYAGEITRAVMDNTILPALREGAQPGS